MVILYGITQVKIDVSKTNIYESLPLTHEYSRLNVKQLTLFSVPFTDNDSTDGRKLLRSQFDGKSSLFYVELPEGKILLHRVDDNEKFPVQFGREVCWTNFILVLFNCQLPWASLEKMTSHL